MGSRPYRASAKASHGCSEMLRSGSALVPRDAPGSARSHHPERFLSAASVRCCLSRMKILLVNDYATRTGGAEIQMLMLRSALAFARP